MIIEKLTLTDFRVFKGKHEFDLRPRIKGGKSKPIILYGGLNGTGKTTTLTAVRLTLYGKQSLGNGVAQKVYEEFLRNSIHRNKKSPIPTNSSKIELVFTYASLGKEKHYRVAREWVDGGKVVETIKITEDDKELTELNNEQCQAFLNELIPIGVSDLFFFDGEKIAELAEDTGGAALGEAIKKLLGLNIIDTLSSDLNLITRNQLKKDSSADIKQRLETLELNLEEIEGEAETLLTSYEAINAEVKELGSNADKIEQELSGKGGAWASSRENEIKKHASLEAEKTVVENQMRDIFSSNYPMAIASDFCKSTQVTLSNEKAAKNQIALSETIATEVTALSKSLNNELGTKEAEIANALIDNQFAKFASDNIEHNIVHDVSGSTFSGFCSVTDDAISNKQPEIKKLSQRLEEILYSIDNAGKNIGRAPDKANIKPYIDKLNTIRNQLNVTISKRTKLLEGYKRKLREAIEIARNLDKLSQEVKFSENSKRSYELAVSARRMLRDFSTEMASRKVKELEQEFIKSFRKLARKDDLNFSTQIDNKNFSVTLTDEKGNQVNKDELSAGEKQIYAIAILEALAKTSGHNLPIIIDTPLGRLDSIHRDKLIKSYFPTASHQVVILSTDTEVSEAYYSELSSSISHAYKLDFDSSTASTSAIEGYFWEKKIQEVS